jgi:hypothetical protein
MGQAFSIHHLCSQTKQMSSDTAQADFRDALRNISIPFSFLTILIPISSISYLGP